MKLEVKGVETIEITDPNKLCGSRKRLDKELLQKIKGQDFTAKELKHMFGYGRNTALCDTQLASLVEPVSKKLKWCNPHYASRSEEISTKWRVK